LRGNDETKEHLPGGLRAVRERSNENGQVDIEDIHDVVDRWRQQVGLPYDCDSDGFITVRDITCAVARWGETCA